MGSFLEGLTSCYHPALVLAKSSGSHKLHPITLFIACVDSLFPVPATEVVPGRGVL